MWPVGTIVVCINNKGLSIPYKFNKPLEENEYYTIRQTRQTSDGRWGVTLNEIRGIINPTVNLEWGFKIECFRSAESTHDEKELVCQLTNSSI